MKTTEPVYPEYPLTLTREQLALAHACDEGLEAFGVRAPGGTLTISTVADHVALLSSPLAEFEGWSIERGLMPPIVATSGDKGTSTSGYYGTSTSGDYGTSTSGYYGTSTSGDYGTSTSGDKGTSTSGYYGTSTSGYYGTSTSGRHGTSTSGDRGTSTSGDGGTSTSGRHGTSTSGDRGTSTSGDGGTSTSGYKGNLAIHWFDGYRYRLAVAYVGEDGILPDVPYKLDDQGRFVRAVVHPSAIVGATTPPGETP